MPIYRWRCKTCEGVVEVLRDVSSYDVPPDADEDPKGSECSSHKPERILGATSIHRGPSWGKKGELL